MDGKVDLTLHQCPIQFLRPQRLAADFRQRPVLNPVAARLDDHRFDRVRCPAMPGAQRLGRHARLRQCKG